MSRWTPKQLGFMKEAIRLARRGLGLVSPNPLVGAVLAKNNRLIAAGWHQGPGQAHAEVMALAEAGRKAQGAELYVNLEPCAHYGRTGPCAEAIVQAGVKKVYYAINDPNPLAAGGAQILAAQGVEVDRGLMAAEAWELNQFFLKWATTKLPFVILKTAASLDGKIATRLGDSRWITDKPARNFGHIIRAAVDAILIGRNTAFKDDPELSARPWGKRKMHRQPWRVVLDPHLKLPLTLKIYNPDFGGPTVVACAEDASPETRENLTAMGHQVWTVAKTASGLLSLKDLMKQLGAANIQSILIEPGATLAFSALVDEPVVDLGHIFLAPIIIGGRDSPSLVGGLGIESLTQAQGADILKIGRKGPDIHLVIRPAGGFSPQMTSAALKEESEGKI
ncbi:MAG: bifunctional diaminohydroxyphosphoribosylaminopyrimidine deaminase/5-amino-6-(5-phosphoribosylamino)uracil reductase RibD [Deltaproteobacteria bacterium]|jgi:diaminohydroxyphosphoribosylaminopyrimidine deaminase/5-amino-6-(5-phosphoribosylamino)uracil reductase|nr:bifunctional diaminohydroxyphosphoribosylaminopyrimidine deaminase/5-amino-6-(5-phosphoribosylamino)uracil reductase RibD [Deltaproteobacteria bacterium]